MNAAVPSTGVVRPSRAIMRPLTPDGFLMPLSPADLRDRLAGVRQWAPEACDGGWAPMSLFDLAGQTATARPALDAVRQGLVGRL